MSELVGGSTGGWPEHEDQEISLVVSCRLYHPGRETALSSHQREGKLPPPLRAGQDKGDPLPDLGGWLGRGFPAVRAKGKPIRVELECSTDYLGQVSTVEESVEVGPGETLEVRPLLPVLIQQTLDDLGIAYPLEEWKE